MKKAAVVSQGGHCRTIDNDSLLAAPPFTGLLGLGVVLRHGRIDPGVNKVIGFKQIPATRRLGGPHRSCCLVHDQHDFAKVNAVVLSVKPFLTISCTP
jgi:hypothetical protein